MSNSKDFEGFATENDIQNDKNAIRLDPNKYKNNEDDKHHPSHIPDIEEMLKNVISIVEFVSTPEMTLMEKNNNIEYKKIAENAFPEFSNNYISIFNMLLNSQNREHNLGKLVALFSNLKEIKEGRKNIDTEYNKFQEKQAEEYIYPKFGGKKQFEMAMLNEAKKNKK